MNGEADSMTDELLATLRTAGVHSRGDLAGRLLALFDSSDCWIAGIAAQNNKATWQAGNSMYLEAVRLRADLGLFRPADPDELA